MRYVLHKENDKWWICLEGPGVHGIYQPTLLIQHELIMEFSWFEGEGTHIIF